jgi:hypothetical protein
MAVQAQFADRVSNGVTAVALSHHANDITVSIDAGGPSASSAIEKALAATTKAYSLYQLPIFLFHLGRFLQLLGLKTEARTQFGLFVRRQGEFSGDNLDAILVDYEGTDVADALTQARRAGRPWNRLGGSTVRRKLRADLERELHQSPVFQLGQDIIVACWNCREAVRPLLERTQEKDKTLALTEATFEFVYFFLHLASRVAYTTLGLAKRELLTRMLGEQVPQTFLDALFGNWPIQLKDGMRSEFFQNLNNAEQEYSQCHALLPRKDVLSDESLFSTLARNVARHLGHDKTADAIGSVQAVALLEYGRLRLEERIRQVGNRL